MQKFLRLGTLFAWGIIIYNLASVMPNPLKIFQPVYNNNLYRTLENLYNQSQYRQKNPTSIIPDHTVFRYAAGAYLRGVDPILINSETTPLGKYFIAFSILVFRNDETVIIGFALLALYALWLLGGTVLKDPFWAVVPLVLFSSEPLYLDQIRVAPMLDIIQLPFILFSLYFFLREYGSQRFFVTALMLGLVIATKTLIPGILLVGCFVLFLAIKRLFRSTIMLLVHLPIAALILILSYARTFLDGYTFIDFLSFQKWILLYQQSKLLYPLSVWRLIFLNQWQTWWGDRSILHAVDWRITWPLGTGLSVLFVLLVAAKKIRFSSELMLLLLWVGIYAAFLSLGVVSSRFLLPFLPVTYILATCAIRYLSEKRI